MGILSGTSSINNVTSNLGDIAGNSASSGSASATSGSSINDALGAIEQSGQNQLALGMANMRAQEKGAIGDAFKSLGEKMKESVKTQ